VFEDSSIRPLVSRRHRMFQDHMWLAQADARAIDPADSVNGGDHRGDRPGEEKAPVRHPSPWQRLVRGFPWQQERQQR